MSMPFEQLFSRIQCTNCFWDLFNDAGSSFDHAKKLVLTRKYFQKCPYNFKMWCNGIVVTYKNKVIKLC